LTGQAVLDEGELGCGEFHALVYHIERLV
jgi:hypothetical protein